jgi:hypothetical protein
MKNSNCLRNSFHPFAASVLVVATMLAASAAFAGGRNAPEKGAMQLLKPNAASAGVPASAPTKMNLTPCSQCKNVSVTLTHMERGHIQTPAVSQRHLCPGCEQKQVTTGVGKAARTEVKHICSNTATGKASCCVAQVTPKAAK